MSGIVEFHDEFGPDFDALAEETSEQSRPEAVRSGLM
jgi:hypothetical protein